VCLLKAAKRNRKNANNVTSLKTAFNVNNEDYILLHLYMPNGCNTNMSGESNATSNQTVL